MSSTTIPPLGRGVLATGKRVGRHFHTHVLGLAIIRDQLHDGDVMIENDDGAEVVRMRTERREPVPLTRPRLTRAQITVALATQDTATTVLRVIRPRTEPMPRHLTTVEPSTARIITGLASRRRLR